MRHPGSRREQPMRLEGTAPRGALGGVTGGVTLQKQARMMADVDGRRLSKPPKNKGSAAIGG